jgi:hypothetical protein
MLVVTSSPSEQPVQGGEGGSSLQRSSLNSALA